jgi:hypothetical protein
MNIKIKYTAYFLSIFFIFNHFSPVVAQTWNNEFFLSIKKMFEDQEVAALAEEYVGLSSAMGIQEDLFEIRSTGVSTTPIVEAARIFLDSLNSAQKLKTQFSVDAAEWRRWSNVDNGLYIRQGSSIEEMNEAQKEAVWNLLSSSLSVKGIELSQNIMKTDQTLKELNQDSIIYGEEKYFITVMGNPSESEPWGWQLDGHHLVINFFVMGDQIVATPMFLGAEPAVATSGRYSGNAILQDEQNSGLCFLQSLSDTQRSAAVINSVKEGDNIQTQANKDNLTLEYTGIAAGNLRDEQREELINLISLFINNISEEHAHVRMEEIIDHLDMTYFAWVGEDEEDSVFYYRIHSPVVLIEFDHQNPVGNNTLPAGIPTRQHIHTIIRTPNGNDYGKDLLRQHLTSHPH